MSELQPAHAHSANNPISQNLLSIFLLLTCFLFRQQPCPIFPLRAIGGTPDALRNDIKHSFERQQVKTARIANYAA
jgi:hypothetical protein